MALIVSVLEKKYDRWAEKEHLLFLGMGILPLWSITWVNHTWAGFLCCGPKAVVLMAMQNVKLPGLLWRALAFRWVCPGCFGWWRSGRTGDFRSHVQLLVLKANLHPKQSVWTEVPGCSGCSPAFGELCAKDLDVVERVGGNSCCCLGSVDPGAWAGRLLAVWAVSLVMWRSPPFLWERKWTSYQVPRIRN